MIRLNWVTFTIIAVAVVTLGTIINVGKSKNLVSPNPDEADSQITTPSPTATPQVFKQYQFDSATNLEQELDSINPQILETDWILDR
ncbi:hypothetical protein HYW42_03625 [Candidatus Daviesbacteria bacterium]|nr:hypothetical protein [Candidatus Daviesbacteria bacterium]